MESNLQNGIFFNIKENPFLQRSAEDELSFLSEIYYKPVYYDDLMNNAICGSSRMLIGQRGLGKSATIHTLFSELKEKKTLPLLITRYDNIPLSDNECYFLYQILQTLCNGIAQHLFINDTDRKKLNKSQKESLAFFIEMFYDSRTSEDYIKAAKEIKARNRLNWLRRLYNSTLPVINGMISGAVEICGDSIRKAIGLDKADIQNIAKEYFKEANLNQVKSLPMNEVVGWGKDHLIKLLKQLKSIANVVGYQSIVVLFDKIDEYPAVNADVEKIVTFIKDILLDTDLLYIQGVSIVFSIWSDAKRALNKAGFRYDKFEDINIEWTDDELEALINKRLLYFSIDKQSPVTMNSLIPNPNDKKDVLELAGGSPRSLIKLLGTLYNLEHNSHNLTSFRPESISRGTIQYCKTFDYYSNQSYKAAGKIDLYGWINRILQMKRIFFSAEVLKDEFGLNIKGPATYVQNMTKYGLIRECLRPGDDGLPIYEVIEPRIKYLISRGILEIS